MFKKVIKNILPKWLLAKVTRFRSRNSKLHMDDEFLSYVYKKKLGLEKNLDNIQTLVLRGSHADYGVITQGENDIYNLGLTSTDIYLNFKLYEKYSKELSRLKNVVFFYSVFTPGLSLIRINEKYRLVAYKYFLDVPYQDGNMIDEKLERKITRKCRKIKQPKIDSEYFGYEQKNSFMSNISATKRTKTHLRENQREPNQLEWLIKLRDLVNKQGRQLYVVIPPVQKSYMDCLPDKRELFKKLYSLDLENVKVLDFYDSPLFDDSDLGDFDHLNEKGARKLTDELIQYIK